MLNTLLFASSAFALLLPSGTILRTSFLANTLLLCVSLLAVVMVTAAQRNTEAPRQRAAWLLMVLSFVLFLSRLEPQTKPIVAQAYVLALLALILFISRPARRYRDARLAVLWTSFVYFVLTLTTALSPTVGFFMEAYARNASYLLSGLFGLSLRLGPTAMGVWGLAFCVIYTWVRIAPWHRHLWKRGILVSLCLLAVNHVGALLMAWLAHAITRQKMLIGWDQVAEKGFTGLDFLSVTFLADCVILYGFLERQMKDESYAKAHIARGGVGKGIIAGWAAGWFLIIAMAYLATQWPAGNYDGRVLLYRGGITSWNKPSFEELGPSNRPGLFCMLPDYLKTFGFEVNLSEKITPALLGGADVVALMNFNEAWERKDRRLLLDYVRDGGCLMVFADHTDMAGLMKGSNSLLSEVPIRVNFDSAHFLNNYWHDALFVGLHPASRKHWDKDAIGVSVGASLRLSNHRATPLLIARFGFSDKGDRSNAFSENYLGDRMWGLDEPLGDVVLAAEAELGRGKVIVFGDTALLQMGSLIYCQRYVADCFRWAVHGKVREFPWAVVLIVALAATFLLLQRKTRRTVIVVSVIVSVSFSVVIGEWVLQASYQDHNYEGPMAYLDHSHVSLCDHEGYSKDDGDTYLTDNLVRNGFVPMAWKSFNKDALEASSLMTSMAATKPFSQKETLVVDTFMKDGGHLMVLSGDSCIHATREFLKQYGMEIEPIPLGSVPADKNSEGVLMYDANPISAKELTEKEILCSAFGGKYPVVVQRNLGKGKLTAISDYGLFFNGRLEKPDWASPPNIFFLRKCLKTSERDESP